VSYWTDPHHDVHQDQRAQRFNGLPPERDLPDPVELDLEALAIDDWWTLPREQRLEEMDRWAPREWFGR
jgi:hypothetical protein